MRTGVTLAFGRHTSAGFIAEAAQLVEETGLDAIWVPEHVLFFPDYASAYPYSDDGRIPGDPTGILDPFTSLTFLAAHTKRVRLGTGICLVPQRQPVYTARMAADVDFLSDGRLDFGVGIGWLKEEYDNLGMDFAGRAAACDEYVDVMKALWAPGVSEFSGDRVQLAPCHFNPKPVQQPHPPILFGGESRPALRRVAERGDGWFAYDLDPDGLAARLDELDRLLDAAGRRRSELRLLVGPNRHPVNPARVAAYARLGVEQLVLPLGARSIERLGERARQLLDKVHG